MLAGLNHGSELHRPEARRRRKNHEVHPAADQLLIRIQSDELVRHVHLFLMPLLEARHGALDFLREHVGHRRQLDVLVRRQRLVGRAGTAPAAADQPNADRVAVLAVGAAARNQADRGGTRHGSGGGSLEKIPAGGSVVRCRSVCHGRNSKAVELTPRSFPAQAKRLAKRQTE